MDNLIYILFICVVAPLTLMLLMLKKHAKVIIGFMILGIVMSLFVSELNRILLGWFDEDYLYVTTTITPLTEEILKAIPVLIYAIFWSEKQDRILPLAFSIGIGFGLFENTVILVQNIEGVSIAWAVARGFSTALMHGVCTSVIGFGISFIRKKRKLFYCGTFALLALAGIYHGIYNLLVQSDYKYLGFAIPVVTYSFVLGWQFVRRKSKKESSAAQSSRA